MALGIATEMLERGGGQTRSVVDAGHEANQSQSRARIHEAYSHVSEKPTTEFARVNPDLIGDAVSLQSAIAIQTPEPSPTRGVSSGIHTQGALEKLAHAPLLNCTFDDVSETEKLCANSFTSRCIESQLVRPSGDPVHRKAIRELPSNRNDEQFEIRGRIQHHVVLSWTQENQVARTHLDLSRAHAHVRPSAQHQIDLRLGMEMPRTSK